MAVNAKKAIPMIIVVMLVPGIPAVILTLAGWSEGSFVWVLGTLVGIMGAFSSNVRITLGSSALFGVVAMLSVLNQGNPWGAAVIMAILAALAGLMAVRGLNSAVNMLPIAAAFLIAQPPVIATDFSTWTNAYIVGLLALGGALFALLVASTVLKQVHFPPAKPITIGQASLMAGMLAIAVGVSAWIVVDNNLGHGGAWLMMTIVIVAQPGIHSTFRRAMERAIGTILGFVIAMALGVVITNDVAMLIVGLLIMAGAAYFKMNPKHPYWKYVILLTPAVVLLVSSGGQDGTVAEVSISRLGYTILGSIIGLALAGSVVPLYRFQHKSRSHSSA